MTGGRAVVGSGKRRGEKDKGGGKGQRSRRKRRRIEKSKRG